VTLGAKAAIPSAAACDAMCQPSSKSAIDPNAMPAMISTTIIEKVSTITHRVLCSSEWSVPNVRECCREWISFSLQAFTSQYQPRRIRRGHLNFRVGCQVDGMRLNAQAVRHVN
jgi:hypothetical protein